MTGFIPALFGKKFVFATIYYVETFVEKHYEDQILLLQKYKSVNKFLDIPEELMLFCGMGIGFADENDPINTFRSKREDIDDFADFIGF